jgi:CheY-like chemotaxis protein
VPAKLLVADDSTTIQKVFERTFPSEEFALSFANNGEEALAKARAEKPQVIIADINMPIKNGFELCEAIKKDPDLKGIPILLLIGILDDFDEDESQRVGADGFIVKPFEANAALGKVRAALSKGQSALPRKGPVGGRAEDILELSEVVEEPSKTSRSSFQEQGNEEILELSDIAEKSPGASPSLSQEQEDEGILELEAMIKESSAPSIPPPRQKPTKEEEFILQSPLRDLEEELKAEFPEQKEAEEAPVVQEEREAAEKEEAWNLDLDLSFDKMATEPQPKDADWTSFFGDLGIEEPQQEIKDERLGTILDESATELEKIEGIGPAKQEKHKEEEFAEKFMEEFEPVFAKEDFQDIDLPDKDRGETPTEGTEDLAEKMAAALSHELKAAIEKVIKDKVPALVRQEMERLKKA